MKSSIKDFGTGGLSTDIAEFDLPPNVFTVAKNVRVHDGVIGNISCGYTLFQDTAGDIPLDVAAFRDTSLNTYWTYAVTDKIVCVDPGPTTIGTGFNAAYWSSCVLTDVPVWCNEADAPQYWPVVDGTTSVLPLPWDATNDWDNAYGAVYRAEVIRPHKNFLFALNINEGGVKSNSMVHWSAPADPGLPPPTWAYREPDNLSGRVDIAETAGEVVDGLTLGDAFLVYKTDSVWRFTFVGGNAVFRRTRIQSMPGALSRECIVQIEIGGGSHVVLSKEDLYIHNGQTFKSLITNRTRSRFLKLIDPLNSQKAFLVKNSQYKEVWICVPTSGSDSDSPVLAAVWSWEDDTWTERELPELLCATEGKMQNPGRVLINDAVGIIGDDHTLINQVSITPQDNGFVAGMKAGSLIQYDTSTTNAGVPFLSWLRREYLQLNDTVEFNTVTSMFPSMTWSGGPDTVNIRMGSHNTPNGPVRWDGWKVFDLKSGRKLSPRITGSYHALEMRTDNGAGWGLSAIVFEHSGAGER